MLEPFSSGSPEPISLLRSAIAHDPAAAARAGLLAMKARREAEALPLLAEAVRRHPRDARLWQIHGLSARALDDLTRAVTSLTRARDLAPTDPLIAHGAARARLEAGLDSVDDFLRARRLAPADGSILQGLAAARLAAGDLEAAIAELATVLRAEPLWLDGHATLARLRRMAGDPDPLASYHVALAKVPDAAALWAALLSTLQLAERFDELPAAIAAAQAAIGEQLSFAELRAIAAEETGDHEAAARHFDSAAGRASASVWLVRSLLRRGRADEAARFAEQRAAQPDGRAFWPYLALAWRLTGDPRWTWLEGDPAFVQVHDLADEIGDLGALAARLRALHMAKDRPLDQSVRGGTQSDGPLLSRVEPEIAALRHAIRDAVARYIEALPPHDPAHPLLSAARTPIRFAGSWSVRLSGGGYHADHVHPEGWISSALYVALPDEAADGSGAGWLTLGACEALIPALAPFRSVEPKPGRLVLFPSTMWHGTRPFSAGERLTVAFDVARYAR